MEKRSAMVLRQSRISNALRSWLARAVEWLWFFGSRGKPLLKEEKISLIVLIIVVGFAIAVAYHYAMGYYLGKPWPANTFLHKPEAHFFDFTLVVRQSATLDPFSKDIGGFAGAPFAQFIGYLFSIIHIAWLQLCIFFGSFFIVFLLMAKHYLYGLKSKLTSYQLLAIFAIVFLTYPVLFAVDRANFDLLVCASLFLFALTYGRQQYKASTVFLALAIAIKPFAAIFIMVYILDKRYKDVLLVIFNAVFLTALSLSLFKGGLFVETQNYFNSLFNIVDSLSAGNRQTFITDLYSLLTLVIKFIGDKLGTEMYLPAHPEARILYGIMAIIVFIYFVIYLWNKHPPLWKVMAVLAISVILLPFHSVDYRLTYLLVPMLMYLGFKEQTRNDLLIIILWGLLLVPKNYYTLQSPQNIGMVINPLLLISLLICIIPDAFSIKGIASALGFADTKIQSKERVNNDESK
jgi:hypothetical protein